MGIFSIVSDLWDIVSGGTNKTEQRTDYPDPSADETSLQGSFLDMFISPTIQQLQDACPQLGDMRYYDSSIGGWKCENLEEFYPNGIVTQEQWDAIQEEKAPFDVKELLTGWADREAENYDKYSGKLDGLSQSWESYIDEYKGYGQDIYSQLNKDYANLPKINMGLPSSAGKVSVPIPPKNWQNLYSNQAQNKATLANQMAGYESQGLGNIQNLAGLAANAGSAYNQNSLYPLSLASTLLNNMQNLRVGQATVTNDPPNGVLGALGQIVGAYNMIKE